MNWKNHRSLQRRLATGVMALCLFPFAAHAGQILDGDFVSWTSTPVVQAVASGSGNFVATGGNPGANYHNNITDNVAFFDVNYVVNIKNDYTFTGALTGTPFSMNLDVLADTGIGGSVGLAVQQGGSLFVSSDLYGPPQNTWTAEPTLNGFFNTGNFARISGSGTLDFSGGVPTQFGFYQHDQQTLGSNAAFYDNFNLQATPLPEPGSLALGGLGLVGLLFAARRNRIA